MGRFLKILILVLLAFFVLTLTIYSLLFSVILANQPGIVNLRRIYADFTDKVRIKSGVSLEDFDNYTYLRSPIRVFGINKPDGEYNYGFIGKLEKVDQTTNQLIFDCCNNQRYVFNAIMIPVPNETTKTRVADIPNTEIVLDSNSGENRKFLLVWKDKITLQQILNKYKASPQVPINGMVFPVLLNMYELTN